MRPLDLLTFAGVCLVWALNLIVSRVLFTQFAISPIFYAAIRFALVALLLAPLLRPLPRPLLPLLGIGLLLGACHFGLMFIALSTASAAGVSIVLQLSIPITAVLSMVILSEKIGRMRGIGIVLAFIGVIIVMWQPDAGTLSIGLVFAFLSAAAIALGSVLVKRYGPIHPLRLQGWVGVASFLPLTAYSVVAEHNQWDTAIAAGWPFWAGLAFSVAVVTIFAHTLYFGLLQKYPASLIAPLGLMTPLMTIAMGVLLLGEHFDLRMAIGGVLALGGLLLILMRPTPQIAAAQETG
jgi:drug/metabolite transporter (DMT)-like permease